MRAKGSFAARLAAHSANVERRRTEERQRAIADMFADLPGLDPADDFHDWDEWGDPQDPLPDEREAGRRYCRGCGVKKRTKSFDAVDGKLSERCRACSGGPKARSQAA